MRQHLVSHWRVWLLIVVVVVVVNEVVDRNFFDHREHIDGDVALAVVALIIAFFGSYLVARRTSRARLRPSGVERYGSPRACTRLGGNATPPASARGSFRNTGPGE